MANSNKVFSLKQLIQQFISDGDLVYLEGMLANRSPIAAVHEVIRAQRRNLKLVSAPNGLAIDQLIGAGCVAELEFYFLGFMTRQGFASMHRFREAVEANTIQTKESMGYAIAMALRASAFGIPFIPIPDFRGSDLLEFRDDYQLMTSPYDSKETVVLVPALRPDVLLLHAHTADSRGNIVLDEPWPTFTLTTAQACKTVLVTVEEIVTTESLNPRKITIPHFLVDGIAQVPFGAVPTALNQRYEIHFSHIQLYQEAAKSKDGFINYLQKYILRCPTHLEFLKNAGKPPPWMTDNEKVKTNGKEGKE